ncbi:hypothetical protein J1G42_12310 [Cellulomonas sp. zg-ZUI222]|uniref:Uncharacterized protein n=1 Tax=Cellulomonas wangleii TaxID=2816956 RepID=A0ABX8D7S3_9CELL|nr:MULTISPECIES: hypothetical protein [Cellulomonas]MBO0900951.1 hypothetical protein [Cellulomonas sp. zg-ZUI22]MBO0921606.1 hypothetical protein [Cellulomonas wangleii]MBO0925102.1 hypothetical protein [Cellulomonas wangleii]QVI63485.1 hypothetical protein KG103_06365 [Cellulomonas wangleii]
MSLFGTGFGVRATQIRATSAHADAPLVPLRPGDLRAERRARRRRTRPSRTARARLAAASLLHRLADALTPAPERLGRPVA